MSKSKPSLAKKISLSLAAVTVLLLTPVVCIIGLLLLGSVKYKVEEYFVDRRFWREANQQPQLQVQTYKLWEGNALVTATINGEGPVYFWYGWNGVPSLNQVDNLTTDFSCYTFDKNFRRLEKVYSTGLTLNDQSRFAPLFSVRINSLAELAQNYSQLVTELKTHVPNNPPLTTFVDQSVIEKVPLDLESQFRVASPARPGKRGQTYCEVYVTSGISKW